MGALVRGEGVYLPLVVFKKKITIQGYLLLNSEKSKKEITVVYFTAVTVTVLRKEVLRVHALTLWLDKTLIRILLALLVSIMGFVLTAGFLTDKFEENGYNYRRQELKRITEVARNAIEPVIQQYRSGVLTRQQAMDMVRGNIRTMTYNDIFGPNYVFMSTYEGIMLVQPFEQKLEGSDQSRLTDAYGLPIIANLIDKARQGEGYVTYYYHPPGRSQPQQKISYVVGIPELEAYIGTGMYVEDIQLTYDRFRQQFQSICLLFFLLIMSIQYTLLQPVFSSYRLLIQAFDQLGNNPEEPLTLPSSLYRKGSEAGRLITGFNSMVGEIQEKNVAMQQAHEELTQSYEEITASNEELLALYTQLTEADELRQISEERYRLAMDGINDAVYDWDLRTNKMVWAGRWSDILGVPDGEVLDGKDWWVDMIHPEDKAVREQALADHLAGKTPMYSAEFRIMSQTGEYIWILSRGKAIFDLAGNAIRMVGSFSNISDKKRKEEEIWWLAYRDSLTGLANRQLFMERLRAELLLAQQGEACGAMLYLDLDNFKLVNDTCGHSQGDQLLVEIANKLVELVVGDGHLVARLGGDEFVVLLTDITQEFAIAHMATNILRNLAGEVNLCGHHFTLSVSIGIARYPFDGTEVGELLKNADTALYVAKNAGKNVYRFFEEAMQEDIIEKLSMERSLREAMANDELELYFQPIVSLSTGKIGGYEALLRWHNLQRGMVSPGRFIPLMEESGLIVPIGAWVMRTACAFARKLMDRGCLDSYVAVNVSVKQLINGDFVSMVKTALAEAGVPPTALELEITETILMDSEFFDDNVAKLRELKATGVRIALDDFGTGYSSLTYLKQLPIDIVKIDKSFVDDLAAGGKNKLIMGSIIALAHNLGLTVVAEGVETEAQRDLLREFQCDFIQGYIISRPAPAAEMLEFNTV